MSLVVIVFYYPYHIIVNHTIKNPDILKRYLTYNRANILKCIHAYSYAREIITLHKINRPICQAAKSQTYFVALSCYNCLILIIITNLYTVIFRAKMSTFYMSENCTLWIFQGRLVWSLEQKTNLCLWLSVQILGCTFFLISQGIPFC